MLKGGAEEQCSRTVLKLGLLGVCILNLTVLGLGLGPGLGLGLQSGVEVRAHARGQVGICWRVKEVLKEGADHEGYASRSRTGRDMLRA